MPRERERRIGCAPAAAAGSAARETARSARRPHRAACSRRQAQRRYSGSAHQHVLQKRDRSSGRRAGSPAACCCTAAKPCLDVGRPRRPRRRRARSAPPARAPHRRASRPGARTRGARRGCRCARRARSSVRCASLQRLGRALPLEILRQRVRRLYIIRTELQGALPVTRSASAGCRAGSRSGRAAAGCRAFVGRELRRLRQPLAAGVDLLLAQEQQPEVRPRRPVRGHDRDDALELLPREHLLAGLERREPCVERDDGFAVVSSRGRLAPARRARGRRRPTQRQCTSTMQRTSRTAVSCACLTSAGHSRRRRRRCAP